MPFPATSSSVPAALVGLTNQQLWTQYGLAMEGSLAPAGAVSYANGAGLAGTPQVGPDYYRLVSPVSVTSGPAYTLQYLYFHNGDPVGGPVTDPTTVTLRPGWNVITRVINGATHSWLVDYVVPAQATSLAITGLNYPQPVGTPVTITVTALDANGNPVTGYAGKVTFHSSDLSAALPASYTFTSSDQGSHTFVVTFNTAGRSRSR